MAAASNKTRDGKSGCVRLVKGNKVCALVILQYGTHFIMILVYVIRPGIIDTSTNEKSATVTISTLDEEQCHCKYLIFGILHIATNICILH